MIKSAKAKKHILCEKPIATEIEDAEEMIRVCEEEGVILQIAYPVRFSPALRKAKDFNRKWSNWRGNCNQWNEPR